MLSARVSHKRRRRSLLRPLGRALTAVVASSHQSQPLVTLLVTATKATLNKRRPLDVLFLVCLLLVGRVVVARDLRRWNVYDLPTPCRSSCHCHPLEARGNSKFRCGMAWWAKPASTEHTSPFCVKTRHTMYPRSNQALRAKTKSSPKGSKSSYFAGTEQVVRCKASTK